MARRASLARATSLDATAYSWLLDDVSVYLVAVGSGNDARQDQSDHGQPRRAAAAAWQRYAPHAPDCLAPRRRRRGGRSAMQHCSSRSVAQTSQQQQLVGLSQRIRGRSHGIPPVRAMPASLN
ncbi:hypothetical protein EMIT0111MI5_210002 [Burkholderia sp. IT-111MI5]